MLVPPFFAPGLGPRQLTCLFNHLVGADGQGRGARPSSSSLKARLHLLAPRSHRRRYTIPTDPPRAALQRSVRLLDRGDEDFLKVACSCRQLQNIRLSSDVPNPLSETRNWQADGDGWVGAG